jgi:hypothetical protein
MCPPQLLSDRQGNLDAYSHVRHLRRSMRLVAGDELLRESFGRNQRLVTTAKPKFGFCRNAL